MIEYIYIYIYTYIYITHTHTHIYIYTHTHLIKFVCVNFISEFYRYCSWCLSRPILNLQPKATYISFVCAMQISIACNQIATGKYGNRSLALLTIAILSSASSAISCHTEGECSQVCFIINSDQCNRCLWDLQVLGKHMG